MSDDTSTYLAVHLKRLREAQGLSQAAVAEQSGVPRPTIAHLESGQANPTLSVVLRVARTLGVSIDSLVLPEQSPIVVLGPRTLPQKRGGKVKGVELLPAGTLREPSVERLELRPGGRLSLSIESGELEVIVAEQGHFELVAAETELELPPEHVAYLRASATVGAPEGGVLLRFSGRAAPGPKGGGGLPREA